LSEVIRFSGRGVIGGLAEGPALVTNQPLSFFGDVDPNTGNIISERSEIRGKCVWPGEYGRILRDLCFKGKWCRSACHNQ